LAVELIIDEGTLLAVLVLLEFVQNVLLYMVFQRLGKLAKTR
jgi:hypothetical protein